MANKILCKYHPQVAARRHCPACNVNFCARCSKPEEKGSDVYRCPLCHGELEAISLSNVITPFWERIPKFFAYPAKIDSLVYVGSLSIVSIVGVIPHKFTRIAFLLILFAIIDYAFKCLNHTARGNLSPPDVLVSHGDGQNLAKKQVGVFIAMFGMVGLIWYFIGSGLALAAGLLVLLSIPAAIMILAIEGSFFAAIHPGKWIRLMQSVGKSYLILYLFLLMLSGTSSALQTFLGGLISPYLLIVPAVFIFGYFTVAMYHMMGYVIYQYHEELGFECVKGTDAEEESLEQSGAADEDPLQNELNILLNEGKMDAAKALIEKIMAREGGETPELHERYHKLLVLTQDKEALLKHGENYIRTLLEGPQGKKNMAKAMGIYADCLTAKPDYYYPDAQAAHDMAEMASRWNKHDMALRMLNKFAQRYADSPVIPKAYFLAAKILSEKKREDAQAKKILTSLLKRFPGHEVTPHVENYLKTLENLQSS